MNGHILITISLGLGWLLAAGMGVAILAMAGHIGNRYVFSAEGVTRIGPRIGQEIGPVKFTHRNGQASLSEVISPKKPTVIVFLNARSRLTTPIVADLFQIAKYTANDFQFVALCRGPCETIEGMVESRSNVQIFALNDSDTNLSTELGLRVAPYGLLVDPHGRLIAKGLANHTQHLCVLLKAAQPHLSEEGKQNVVSRCESDVRATPLIPVSAVEQR